MKTNRRQDILWLMAEIAAIRDELGRLKNALGFELVRDGENRLILRKKITVDDAAH